ncbi:hypothetical protein [Paenibacillus kandeliae]|uniref:hypothetical protein n=1 Tax=Paenibacillus kandeliae TaxID=3231269 RepID=UPI0034576A00
MTRTAITCDMSRAGITASVQDAMHYTPPVLRIEGSAGSVELLLTSDQLDEVEQAILDYKERLKTKGSGVA